LLDFDNPNTPDRRSFWLAVAAYHEAELRKAKRTVLCDAKTHLGSYDLHRSASIIVDTIESAGAAPCGA